MLADTACTEIPVLFPIPGQALPASSLPRVTAKPAPAAAELPLPDGVWHQGAAQGPAGAATAVTSLMSLSHGGLNPGTRSHCRPPGTKILIRTTFLLAVDTGLLGQTRDHSPSAIPKGQGWLGTGSPARAALAGASSHMMR